jgi:LmbE family N-acetylglucosaminyl deacetylase
MMSFRWILAIVDQAATMLWVSCFRIMGGVQSRRILWHPSGTDRVLVIAPHPDDEAIGCGGAVMEHLEAGEAVDVIYATDGRRSRSCGLSELEMAEQRRRESEAAIEFLGVGTSRWLGLPEGQWNKSELTKVLSARIDLFQPTLIYAPCWLDYHPEHRKVAMCLSEVVSSDVAVRIYTLHIPLGRLCNTFVDVGERMTRLAELFNLYKTQRSSLIRGLRLRRYAAARAGRTAGVEEYLQVNGDAYRRAHTMMRGSPRIRGVRYWSFTDPLSYVLGGKARRKFYRALAN